MSIKTRTQKTKTWIKNHQEQIAVGSVATAIVALYATAVVLAVKQDKANAENEKKLRDWTINENAKGRSVFQLADGNLLSVDANELLS